MSFFGGRRQVEPPPPARPETPPPTPPALPPPVGFETVLGTNSVIEGVLRSSANVRLDGTFSGTLEITGNVLIGETARINADIHAKNISVAGAVRGNIIGKKVQLLRTGRVWGDIRAMALTTEEGAFIDGKITMLGQEPPAAGADVTAVEASVAEAVETVEQVSADAAGDGDTVEAEVEEIVEVTREETEALADETDDLQNRPPWDRGDLA